MMKGYELSLWQGETPSVKVYLDGYSLEQALNYATQTVKGLDEYDMHWEVTLARIDDDD